MASLVHFSKVAVKVEDQDNARATGGGVCQRGVLGSHAKPGVGDLV